MFQSHPRYSFILISILFFLTPQITSQLSTSGNMPSTSIILKGCLDDDCLQRLSSQQSYVAKCFDPLREHFDIQLSDYGIKLCCNVAKFEQCLFPFIISFCGMDSLDRFDSELRSLNSICSMTTLQWNKCEMNKTSQEIDSELKE